MIPRRWGRGLFSMTNPVASEPALARVQLPPPRMLVLGGLWAVFVLWNVVETVFYAGKLLFGSGNEFARYGISDPTAGLFALNVWALAAAAVFGLVILNPFAWLNGKRLIFGCMAFAAILGRLASSALPDVLLSAPIYGLVKFVATPFVLLLGGAFALIAIAFVIALGFGFFVGLPVMVFQQILTFDNALHVYRYQARGLAGYIVRAIFWLRNEPMPDAAPDDSKGARMATMKEIQALYKDAPESMGFGHLGSPLLLKTDKHVLIMASTRSGKGVTLIIPHLLRYPGSAFVLDPKGENAKATGRQREKLNGKVHYLDPFGISGKPQARFNPMSRFTPENMESESKALASALFVFGEGKRDHFEEAGLQLLSSIILFVYASPLIPPEEKDLLRVRKELLGNLKNALKAMVKMDDADGLLRDLANSFLETPQKEFGSIASAAQRQTAILDNPGMIACLKATDKTKKQGEEVDFAAWRNGTMTVYLCLAAPKFPVFNRWLRLILTAALDEMTETLNPPKLPVCFMLDELATLGHLPAVENAVGLAAGYGIQLVTVFQDVAQMRDLYKGRWASFIGNAGVRALFNLDDFDTAKYWSDFMGGNLVETRSTQQDMHGLSGGSNVSEAMRPLFPPEKIMLDFSSGIWGVGPSRPSKMLVLATGAHPVITDRVAYFDDRGLDGLWDDPRTPTTAPLKWPSPPSPHGGWTPPQVPPPAPVSRPVPPRPSSPPPRAPEPGSREPEPVPPELAAQRASIARNMEAAAAAPSKMPPPITPRRAEQERSPSDGASRVDMNSLEAELLSPIPGNDRGAKPRSADTVKGSAQWSQADAYHVAARTSLGGDGKDRDDEENER